MSAYTGNKEDNRYKVWVGMRQRCNNPNDAKYQNYGGRGISYDPAWDDFKTFCMEVGERPEGTTLDRIDNDGHYCQFNCRWATAHEQAANRRPRSPMTEAPPNSSTGILGVSLLGNGNYRAQVKRLGKNTILYEGGILEKAIEARQLWNKENS